jgi:response regulator RpfG family c-di-GMP phosphodiesterase
VESAAFEFDERENSLLVFDPAVILIADDIDYNRELLKTFLEPYNFKILECQMTENLKESMTTLKPDVVFMDVKHTDSSALELMGWLKSDIQLKETSLIPFAALPGEEDEKKVEELTGHFLRKPVSRIMVLDELKKILRYTE